MPTPTAVYAIRVSPTTTESLVTRMTASRPKGTVTGPLPRTVDLEPGCKVKPYRRPVNWGYGDHVRISELAERVGVPTSTVRYYERVGLLGQPARTSSGYRDYGEDEATRLVFVSRAR